MIRLVYGNKAFKILDEYQIEYSNSDVTFNDIKIDFTGYGLADMPVKYQEVQIKECKDNQDILTEGKVIFLGYVDTIKPSAMQMSNEHRELDITLLSPLKIATVRSVTLIGQYSLKDAIKRTLQPLVNDGFTVREINVPYSSVLLSYINETIETVMNDLGNKKSLFWYIDENKNITVNSIDYLFGQNIKKVIDNTEGLLKIEPSIQTTDYANVININNARLIYSSYESNFKVLETKIVKKGDSIEFDHPISISKNIGRQLYKEKGENIELLDLRGYPVGTSYEKYVNIMYNGSTDEIIIDSDDVSVTFSDDSGEEGFYVLQRDAFFKELITGFKYNGEYNKIEMDCSSETTLRYTKMRFLNSKEIEKEKGIISLTGQVEKNVDANETWFTLQEMTEYARLLMQNNTNDIDTITIMYDQKPLLQIGDIIQINLSDFYTQGNFAVTKIKYAYKNEVEKTWEITAQKASVISSYIDIFRPTQKQETEEQEESLLVSEFAQEITQEIHNVEEVENED